MQNQNDLKCDGCGRQFNNRNDLDKHRVNCEAAKAKGGSGQQQNQPLGRGAGGHGGQDS